MEKKKGSVESDGMVWSLMGCVGDVQSDGSVESDGRCRVGV